MKDLVLKRCLYCNGNHKANSEQRSIIKKKEGNIKSRLIEKSDFFKHRKLLKNGHNSAGRILRSLQVLKTSEYTLNLI
jgi:hypothetical protein